MKTKNSVVFDKNEIDTRQDNKYLAISSQAAVPKDCPKVASEAMI